jgi:hypothetical protein
MLDVVEKRLVECLRAQITRTKALIANGAEISRNDGGVKIAKTERKVQAPW